MRKKKLSSRTKLAIFLAFIIGTLTLIIFNKATLNSLVPVDYFQDPWPLNKQGCALPNTLPASE